MSEETFDYIIVGAGSAGSVLAGRLSENADHTVCVLEAGGKDGHPAIKTPMLLQQAFTNESFQWPYWTEPQTHLNNRKLFWPRGKTLGGSSSINAMHYMRGAWENYDEWETRYGAAGWNKDSALDAFKRVENNENHSDQWHGQGGPLNVKTIEPVNELTELYFQACQAMQIPECSDHNGEDQYGYGTYQVTQKGGKRCSAADAFLKPARKRPNLTIKTKALAHRVQIEDGRAKSLEADIDGEMVTLHARKEIILCGGALNSPHLLMLSGIGPADHLREHGISVEVDLPGVGENLQDHLDVMARIRTKSARSIGYSLPKLPANIWGAVRWLTTGTGRMTTNPVQGSGFIKSSIAGDLPDIQLVFVPALTSPHGQDGTMAGHGVSMHACHLYPESRGRLRLNSADPKDMILIDPDYVSVDHDMEVMIDCLQFCRDILMSPTFEGERTELEIPSSANGSRSDLSDEVREIAETLYHPTSTCAMGRGEMAVTDSECRVRGVLGLRVVDASVMPRLVGGNTNAPTIMIATRAADMITSAAS